MVQLWYQKNLFKSLVGYIIIRFKAVVLLHSFFEWVMAASCKDLLHAFVFDRAECLVFRVPVWECLVKRN